MFVREFFIFSHFGLVEIMPFVFPKKKRRIVRIKEKKPMSMTMILLLLFVFVVGLPIVNTLLNCKASAAISNLHDNLYYMLSRKCTNYYLINREGIVLDRWVKSESLSLYLPYFVAYRRIV